MRSLYRFAAPLLLAIFLVACGGAYAKAINRGDAFAEAGDWDEAVAAYEQAVKLDPEDPEAKIKIKAVRKRQAAQQLSKARALEQRGELANALALVQEAVSFDPDNTEAQQALTRLTNKVVDKAEQLHTKKKLRGAFKLTTLVLRGSKNHPRARDLDDRLRTALAKKSFGRAKKFAEKDKLGNALVEYAACLTYRKDYPDARIHFGQVKLRLEEELRFVVVLSRLKAKGRASAITKRIDPKLLQQSFDERLLLEVMEKLARGDDHKGVMMRGEMSDYGHNRRTKKITRSCDYVCGTTYKPNPRIQQLRNELSQLEDQLSRHEQDISRKEKDQADAEKKLSNEESDMQKKQADHDKARAKYNDCVAKAPPEKSSPCYSEKSSMNSKQSYLDSARRDVEYARNKVNRLRDDVQSIKQRRDSARDTRNNKNQQLLKEPKQIAIDKYCPHRYSVEQHAVDAKVSLTLSMNELAGDKSIVDGQRFNYGAQAADESFPAQAGRCREVASGDPLNLPSEKDLRKVLVTKVVKDLRGKILASYDAYRRSFLATARRDESSGLTEEATESYVRYVLTGPHDLDNKDKLATFFSKTKGIGKLDALWTN